MEDEEEGNIVTDTYGRELVSGDEDDRVVRRGSFSGAIAGEGKEDVEMEMSGSFVSTASFPYTGGKKEGERLLWAYECRSCRMLVCERCEVTAGN